jgi:2-amino-4-hydroxy-6-hydroxymethyldihydropteridine diphosphokinase
MTDRVFISIGSNLGERVLNCREATRRLAAAEGVTLVNESFLYETEPWGPVVQGPFINCAVEITYRLGPRPLLELLKGIELGMGRTASVPNGPREIDLDILFYGDAVIGEEGLVIPHPRMHRRAFVLAPLAEIAPGFIHPELGKSVAELAAGVEGEAGVKKLMNV